MRVAYLMSGNQGEEAHKAYKEGNESHGRHSAYFLCIGFFLTFCTLQLFSGVCCAVQHKGVPERESHPHPRGTSRSPTHENHSSKICAKVTLQQHLQKNEDLEVKMRCSVYIMFGHMPRSEIDAPMIQYSLANGIEAFPTEKEHQNGLDLSRSKI